jgi:hypothetical protein
MAAVSRPPPPRRLAEDRVCEAEHLAEVDVSGNYHQIIGRRVEAGRASGAFDCFDEE